MQPNKKELINMCDDFDFGFDSDGLASVDNDGDVDERFEEAARFADYAQWDAPSSKKSKGLRKCSKSEVTRIRRRAFIWSRKKIKVGYCASDLVDESVDTVHTLLYNQAFKHINLVPEKTIGPHSRKKVGSVRAIEIDGCTNFQAKDKFPYDADVTIYYRAKKEFRMPFSAKSVRKRNYIEVCEELKALGFGNVQQEPKNNIVTGWLKTEGAIDKVYINGDSSFKEGCIYPFDAEIIVEYDSRLLGKS